jgi:hypothetical protein
MLLEDILDRHPQAITYFVLEGVSPMCCAEVPPERLANFLKRKKVSNVNDFINGLNDFITQHSKSEF